MVRVGVIGAGGIARAHVEGYRQWGDECTVVAVCDPVPGRAEAFCGRVGLTGATVHTDAHAMLAAGGLDLVSVATPPATHAALTVAALRAGVHVLVEKPMAPSLDECDAMVAAAREHGRLLSVVAQNRFRDDMATLKEVLDSGLAGPVTHVRVDSLWWRGTPYYDLDWRGTWAVEGGGCTLNHAVHHLDLLLWLMGRPGSVTALMTNAAHENSEVEDLSVALLRYGRALAEVTASVVHHGEEQGIVVQGRHARISQPWRAVAQTGGAHGFPTGPGDTALVAGLDRLAAAHVPLARTGHAGQIGDVLAAVREGRRPAVTGEAGRDAVELVTAVYASAVEGRTVTLPLAPDDPYRRPGTLVARAPRFFTKTASVAELPGDIVVGSSADAGRA